MINPDVANRYDIFIEKFYPIAPRNNILSQELDNVKRCVWYCNFSGRLVPELQSHNTVNHAVNDASSDDDDVYLSSVYLNNGYRDYNTYQCGHCVYLIYYLSTIFDYINSNYNNMTIVRKNGMEMNYAKKLVDRLNACPICKNNTINRKNIYMINNDLHTGTIIVKNTIPKKYLHLLKSEFTEGDIVDTDGYRGIGLYIFFNKQFKKLNVDEYYAIIPKNITDKYGYITILKNLSNVSFNGKPEFDRLYITQNTFLAKCHDLSFEDNIGSYRFVKKIDFDGKIIHVFSTNKNNYQLTNIEPMIESLRYDHCCCILTNNNAEFVELCIDNDFIILPNKLVHAGILNYLIDNTNLNLEITLNEKEKLIIKNKQYYITDDTNKFVFNAYLMF